MKRGGGRSGGQPKSSFTVVGVGHMQKGYEAVDVEEESHSASARAAASTFRETCFCPGARGLT